MNTATGTEAGSAQIVSLSAIAAAVARRLRVLSVLVTCGLILGLILGLSGTRTFVSGALLVPQASGVSSAGIALAASQFGIRVPAGDGAWNLGLYASVLRSRALLEPLTTVRFNLADVSEGSRTLVELFEIEETDSLRRAAKAIERLRRVIAVAEDEDLGAVRITVRTKWRSVSHALADSLVTGLNQFNLLLRQSQARNERIFLEERLEDAKLSLRTAENRLQQFLQSNRTVLSSAELAFERDRLQRQVLLEQQLFQGLAQSLEEARIQEVRSVPVITVIESPRLALVAEPRRTPFKMAVGTFLGAIVGLLIVGYDLRRSDLSPTDRDKWREFREAVRAAIWTPQSRP